MQRPGEKCGLAHSSLALPCIHRFAHAAGPPDTAGAFVRYHAGADRVPGLAGSAEQPALVWIDLAKNDLRAIAPGRHLAGAFTRIFGIGREQFSGIMPTVRLVEDVA